MADESFLLVSLKEEKAKKLAQTISNETARKILDSLSRKEATETEIARELSLPLSTVHYNLQHLLESNLVKVDEFHYSEKGKEVNHYKLANKLIIIAPENAGEKFLNKLRRILPVGLVIIAAAGVIQFMGRFFGGGSYGKLGGGLMQASPMVAEEASADAAREMTRVALTKAGEVAPTATQLPPVPIVEPLQHVAFRAPFIDTATLWFIGGALFTLIVVILLEWMWRKK